MGDIDPCGMEGTQVTKPEHSKVVVCDDEARRAQEWCERIAETTGITTTTALDPARFGDAVGALKERKAKAKQGDDSVVDADDAAAVFDGADLLVLDSDLTPDRGTPQGRDPSASVAKYLLGELGGEVAHLARCYSTAGPIIVVNQRWKHRVFDLTMMEIAAEVAEAYVSEDDIDNPGLWSPTRSTPGSFRPWHWPYLHRLPRQMSDLIDSVSLNTTVAESLELRSEDLEALTGLQLDALGLDDLTAETTLEEVVSHSAYGLRLKEHAPPEQMLRIAVFGLRRWLDRHVLAAQNVLVDRPHLLQRQPWRIESRGDLSAWNETSQWWDLDARPSGPSMVLGASRWLGRPVWRWSDLASEVPNGPRFLREDPVFCEDVSRFAAAGDSKDFVTDLEGSSAQRFVAHVDDVEYNPKRRLLT